MKVILSLGSNCGNREINLKNAEAMLEKFCGRILKKTGIAETEPWGFKKQPIFLNRIVMLDSDHPPFELLKVIKWIEKRLGRRTAFRWGPRNIDIDILFADGLTVKTNKLTIPHPGVKSRKYLTGLLKEMNVEERCL